MNLNWIENFVTQMDVYFTFGSITFVLVVILQSFVLYCVDASFIFGRAVDCTIFEKVISG